MKSFVLILTTVFLYNCKEPVKLSKAEQYFENKLNTEMFSKNFEEDSEYGYIKIGKFLNPYKTNAVVVSLDSITNLKVYDLKNGKWEKKYQQNNVDIVRINSIEAFIADYNFDGIKDIGIKNQVSNGTAIMAFHLWLSDGESFKHVPEFAEIGNPILIPRKKIVRGFSGCCAFNEMIISDYTWNKSKLNKTDELEINNYPNGNGIEAHLKNLKLKKTNRIKLSDKDISKIINKYSGSQLTFDTTAIDNLQSIQ
ncbi:hypothetical protein NAT51_13605 [Flavobacterium amniphilum]|uniref:XAC2610-related protein n=1 Tax=Flavobacterium amniphilum TaxID=1834035 RepID=UPI00202ABD25|nr:hypothetical protein [Flavobacterium amniphilum]MCL9806566.1 hypothetical protein [Flavobacterium amniphilum]